MYHKTWYVKYKIFISPNIADILDDFDYLGLHFFCSQSNHKLLRTQFMDKGKPNNVHDKSLQICILHIVQTWTFWQKVSNGHKLVI
jgi:hypothetical protein